MRLVALSLVLGSLAVGCVAQVGDPSTEETQRPDEIVAVSGTAKPITPVATPSSTGSTGQVPHPSSAANGNPIPPESNGVPGSGTTLAADNPNPSPWAPAGNGAGH
jgi:hypothetical protein